MRSHRLAWFPALLALGMMVADTAHADRRHHHPRARVGVYVGAPLFWPWYYPPYSPWYPYGPAPVVVVPQTPPAPPVYVERGDEAAAPAPQGPNWYYCFDPPGYYPDVRDCPGGWQAVPPRNR